MLGNYAAERQMMSLPGVVIRARLGTVPIIWLIALQNDSHFLFHHKTSPSGPAQTLHSFMKATEQKTKFGDLTKIMAAAFVLLAESKTWFSIYCDLVRWRLCVSGIFLPLIEPVGHVWCNVCVGCVLRPGSHCASAITGYPERKESMGGGGRGGREGESGGLAYVHRSSG